VACELAEECLPPVEECNGADDDCDDVADDGFDCIRGAVVACTTTCGSAGTGTCGDDCASPAATECSPPEEECNAADDDCDTFTDEVFACVRGTTVGCTTTCGTAGSGSCTESCAVPAAADCTPPAETCNGADDDCADGCDDIFACCRGTVVACLTSCGTTGSGTCTAGCELPADAECAPPAETCNGADDDCDGTCDDEWPCCRGQTAECLTTCGTLGSGTCTESCGVPTGAACTPPAERCNGADDDCDFLCDDGWACCRGLVVPCETTCHTTGSGTCTDDCALPAAGACTPPSEECNGVDDDCDLLCDDGFGCCRDREEACSFGYCTGTRRCGSTCSWSACDFGPVPPGDSCLGTTTPPTIPGEGSSRHTGSTCAARGDWNWACGDVTGAAADVVYRLVLSVRKNAVLETTGTEFDAVLFLRSGNMCPGSTLACDDNGAGGGQARISRTL
jgi:hypothetical protein